MVGMMWENGPFTIEFNEHYQQQDNNNNKNNTKKYNLKYNPYSWNVIGDVIYVEQPIRTGFSIAAKDAKLIRSEKQLAKDFHDFLLSFTTIFPHYAGFVIIQFY
jgi:carboxypeptidase C (cathepsin A)